MIRARQSSDVYARLACRILDNRRRGRAAAHFDWALTYLGDKPGSVKVPPGLLGGRKVERHV